MKDAAAVAFLQWALPRLHMRWRGFRKVRRQVMRRIARRLEELGLSDLTEYRELLERCPEEWTPLGDLCRVTISRFMRDQGVFDSLRSDVLPRLAQHAAGHDGVVAVWCAGCASGEEPYSISIMWKLAVAPRFEGARVHIIATDADPHVLERACEAVYPASSLRELGDVDALAAFVRREAGFELRSEFRRLVAFHEQDLRRAWPDGPFDLVLCRNLAFTYFDAPLAARVLGRITERLRPGGFLLVGVHEMLPDTADLEAVPGSRGLWRRT